MALSFRYFALLNWPTPICFGSASEESDLIPRIGDEEAHGMRGARDRR